MSGVKIHTKEDAYRLFDEAVSAVIGSKFIVTQKPITDLLRCLMYNEQLRTFLTECKKGVDYEGELNGAVVQTETGFAFVLPKGNKRVIALVTGMLRDFATEQRSVTVFLNDFYPDASDNHERYRLFCENVLEPYRDAFRQSFLYDIDDPARGSEEERVEIADAVIEGSAPLFAALRTVFLGDNKLSTKKRDDLIYLTDGLYYALEKGDARIVKTVWTALKLVLADYKKAERKFSDITEFLALYALI